MGYINARGLYVYEETDTDSKASDMLNRQGTALAARVSLVGGTGSISLAGGGAVATLVVDIPPGSLAGTPSAVILQSRSPLGTTETVSHRIVGRNAANFTIEARKNATGSTTWTFDWVAVG